jgi:serine/threonine protein kinase
MGGKAHERSPQTIGNYHIVAKLADGAMGSVFKGHDPATGQTVAIKVAAVALARDPVLLKRFEQEFRSMSVLRHPNIVRALDFGWKDARPYMVMELVDGEDMWARIERMGRLAEGEAVGTIVQVARGLHEAHKHGIIHRDIKPDNILLTANGQAKLADLGLSKDLEADAELTRPDRGLGTPNFIAPEQFADAKNSGVRCDIYALGATLYMALTGRLPFEGNDLATILKKKLANDLASPRSLVPALSERVDWAVRRAVMADPDRRHASCPEFIAAVTGECAEPRNAAIGKRSSPAGRAGKREKKPVQNRRASVRYDCAMATSCTINLSLHADDTEWQTHWDAHVINLSVTGIGLVVSRRFEPGSILAVDLMSNDGHLKRPLKIQVVHVEPAEGRGWYIGGTLTEKLTKDEVRRLL